MSDRDQIAEIYGGDVDNRTSIFLHIEEGLKKNPNGAAVVVMHQPADHLAELINAGSRSQHIGDLSPACLAWTYAELHRAAMRLAAGMMANGVQPGSTMVTLIPNRAEYFLLLWTATIMRLTLASLDFGALTEPRRPELQNYMETLKPDVVVVPGAEGAEAVENAVRRVSTGTFFRMSLNEKAPVRWKSLLNVGRDGMAHSFDAEAQLDKARQTSEPERIAFVMFTSGTSSGKPKGCPRSVASTIHVLETISWGPADLSQRSRILVHTANFRIIAPTLALCAWRAGGTSVMPSEAFSPTTALDAMERQGITNVLLIPAMVHSLVNDPSFRTRKMETLQSVVVTGDMVTRDLMTKTTHAFPAANVCVGHGMTEGPSLFRWPFFDVPVDSVPYYGEIAPLGEVLVGARIRIWCDGAQRVAKRGEPGEIHVCCTSIITHYLDHINEDVFYNDDQGRWFKTGDLGMMNKDGIVYILGRIKDVVKRAGVSITPAALESTIEKFTGSQVGLPIMQPSSSIRLLIWLLRADIRCCNCVSDTRTGTLRRARRYERQDGRGDQATRAGFIWQRLRSRWRGIVEAVGLRRLPPECYGQGDED